MVSVAFHNISKLMKLLKQKGHLKILNFYCFLTYFENVHTVYLTVYTKEFSNRK